MRIGDDTTPPAPERSLAWRVWDAVQRPFGSVGLTCIILLLLGLLTFFGTLEQSRRSLYDVQRDYFESYFHIAHFEPFDGISIPLILPGAYLLLLLLAVNLLVGGLIRMRYSWKTAGVIVAHVGIAMLLIGSFVEFKLSQKGHMSVMEGESANEFESYYDWEVVVSEHLQDGGVREHVIPHDQFADLEGAERQRFVAEDLPFEVVLSGFMRNAEPVPIESASGESVVLEERPPHTEKAEFNRAGVTAVLVPKAGGARRQILLWGGQRYPARVMVDGRPWDVDLRHKSWVLPFEIKLDDFVVERHPGTMTPRRFSSYVTKTDTGTPQAIHITMNEPLRYEGYTLYQSGWGPPNANPSDRLYSVFSVVRNPSDQVPKYACWVIFFGILFAFLRKLYFWMKTQRRRLA